MHVIKGRFCYQLEGTKKQIDRTWNRDHIRAKVDGCTIKKGTCAAADHDREDFQ